MNHAAWAEFAAALDRRGRADPHRCDQSCEAAQAEAWRAVIEALLAHNPNTLRGSGLSGTELAVAEIRRLQQYDPSRLPARPTHEQLEQRVVNVELYIQRLQDSARKLLERT